MTRPLTLLTVLVAVGALGGCTTPMNLNYDFGRAYMAAFQAQADLSRPSAAAAQYRLSGLEGTAIRLRVEASTSDRADETQIRTRNQQMR